MAQDTLDLSIPDVTSALVSLADASQPDFTLRRDPSPEPTPPEAGDAPAWAGVVRLEHAYALGELLGEGGVGRVVDGRHRVLDREVAIKSVRTERRGRGARKSLLREAAATAAVAHPHIIAVHDVAVDENGEPHVVMQKVQGGTWLDYLVEPERITREFGARDLLAWHVGVLEQVCQAMHHAHTRGVLHRDLKPDNVMVGPHGEVYVVDWGLAVRCSEAGPRRLPPAHAERRIVGTPRFMAPEMAAGEGERLSPRTDVYLLGGLLFCVLTGQGPHPGNDVKTTLALVPHFKPCFPEGTPARLASLVRQCMAPDPDDRLESADALRRGLQRWTEERAADDLVAEADRQLAELVVGLAGPDVDRLRAYRRYGAARFGYQRALSAWPEHPAALAGLDRAHAAVATYELDQGDPRAAAVHMGEMRRPDPTLLARLGAAEEARAEADRQAAAHAIDNDPTTRQRTRIFVFSALMLLWTILPLVSWWSDTELTLQRLLTTHLISLCASSALLWWARDSLSRSALNRGVSQALIIVHMALVLGDLGGLATGATAFQVFLFEHLAFAVLAAASHALLGTAALLVSAAYVVVFLVTSARPDLTLPMTGATNLIVALIAFFVWKPDDLRELFFRSPEERARLGRPPKA